MKKTAAAKSTPNPKRVAAGRKAWETRKARALARAKEDVVSAAPNWGWQVLVDRKGRIVLAK